MQRRALVLDANILIRAVLGQRVLRILQAHADSISFFLPEDAYAEAEEHPALVVKRGGDPSKALRTVMSLAAPVTMVGDDLYGVREGEARKPLGAHLDRKRLTSSDVASPLGRPAGSIPFLLSSLESMLGSHAPCRSIPTT
jgi:hypothetical protein